MTKQLLTAGLFALVANTAMAQWSVGLSTGDNLNFWRWRFNNGLGDLKDRPALNLRVALPLEWQMTPALALRAEGVYVQRDFRLRVQFTGPSGVGEEKTIFRRIHRFKEGTFALKISPFASHRQYYFLAGGAFSYLTRTEAVFSKSLREKYGLKRTVGLSEQQLAALDRSQFSADAGAGVQRPLGAKGRLFGECRFQYGLNRLFANPESDIRYRTLCISAGYMRSL